MSKLIVEHKLSTKERVVIVKTKVSQTELTSSEEYMLEDFIMFKPCVTNMIGNTLIGDIVFSIQETEFGLEFVHPNDDVKIDNTLIPESVEVSYKTSKFGNGNKDDDEVLGITVISHLNLRDAVELFNKRLYNEINPKTRWHGLIRAYSFIGGEL